MHTAKLEVRRTKNELRRSITFTGSWILLILVWVWSIKIYVLYLDQQATLAPTSRVNLTPVLFYVLLSGLVILLALSGFPVFMAVSAMKSNDRTAYDTCATAAFKPLKRARARATVVNKGI